MEDDLLHILQTTSFTVDDAYHRLTLVRRFLEHRFFSETVSLTIAGKTLAAFLQEADVPVPAAEALEAWKNTWLPKLSAETFHTVFETVRERLAHIPTITLVVPVALPSAEREAAGAWLRAHTGAAEPLLVDVQVDKRAVGGCRIVYRGQYGDFSFRYFVEQSQAALRKALAGVGV
jgi:F0F1-type ATP synthase delta subunit